MTGTVTGASKTAVLAADYPGWHIWQSAGGTWWATRIGVRHAPDGAPASWAMTISAEARDGLRTELAAQAALRPGRLSYGGVR